MLPQENFRRSEIASEATWDRSRAVVATWLEGYCIQFLAVHVILLSQLTLDFNPREGTKVDRTAGSSVRWIAILGEA